LELGRLMANKTPEQFAVDVLRRLGIKPTRQNVTGLVGWERAEGGHWHNTARFNPLNTTLNLPGSGDTGSQGNISVYRNWRQGEKATAKTLKNGRYEPILDALRGGSAQDVASAIGQTPWGTGGDLVQRTIASTKVGQIPQASRQPPSARMGAQPRTVTTTTPGVDNHAARAGVLLQFLQNRRQPGALATLIQGIQSAQDVPGSTTTRLVPGQQRQDSPGGNAQGVPGRQRAIGWAASKLGSSETLGENRGPLPDKLNARFGFGSTGAQPWCAMFTSTAIKKGGAPKVALSASVAEIRAKAQQKVGYRGFVDPTRAKKGDLILFGNEHIGMVRRRTKNGLVMIAGNDSDQVQQRTVPFTAGDVVRPDYKRRLR
jgi:hypothetical protein